MPSSPNRRILVVDDMPSMHQDFRKSLQAGAVSDKLVDLDMLYCADPSVRYRARRRPYLHALPRYRAYAALEQSAPALLEAELGKSHCHHAAIEELVGGQPILEKASAAYFVKWIDKLTEMASAHPGWRSEKEKAHVLAQFAEARAIYESRAR